MKVIAVIDQEQVIYQILAHLNLLSPGDGPRAPPRPELVEGPPAEALYASPASAGLRELIYEPGLDDLPWPESA
jgi:hypothetical protein